MTTFLIVSFLAGAVLGRRWNVLALLPAILVTLIVALCASKARADAGLTTVLMMAAAAAILQVGYLVGIAVGQFLSQARLKLL
jgi:hypothetical protein